MTSPGWTLTPLRVRFPDDQSLSDEASPDDGLTEVDLIHRDQHLSGLIGADPVDLPLDIPRHAAKATGIFAGHDLAVSWELGDNYYDHPDIGGTARGRFAEQDFTIEGAFHLDPNYAIEGAEISGDIGGKPIAARLQAATGGLSESRTVAIDGTLAGTEFSIFSTISGDLTRGLIRGRVDGHAIRLDARSNHREKTTTVKGTYAGPPAILAVTVGVFLYFI